MNACDTTQPEKKKLSLEERARMFKAIYADTHADYKGVLASGDKTVFGWAKYGMGLQCEQTMCDEELIERYDSAQRKIRRKNAGSYS